MLSNLRNILCKFVTILLSMTMAQAIAQEKSKPVDVVVETVREEKTSDSLNALGTLRANESVRLTTSVLETITAIRFDDGQRVNSGDVLVEMTSAEEKALLTGAQFTLEESEKQLERTRSLVDKGLAPQSELDQRVRNYKNDKAHLAAIESRLQDRLVIAPFSGVVGLRNISVGALISPGELITTLIDDSRMKLDFTVPAVYLLELKLGLSITAKARAFGDREFLGKVTSIDNQIDSSTQSISIRAILENKGKLLKQGLLMNVELHKNERFSILISEAALIPEARTNFVYVATQKGEDVVAEKRQISIGVRREGEVEVLDGLLEGEYIVTHGAVKISDKQSIAIRVADKDKKKNDDLKLSFTGVEK